MIDNLQDLLKELKVPADNWDLLLVGDGSGSKWNNPGGWACTMIVRSRKTGEAVYLTPLLGSVSRGSINWLEAMPYWHCLRHHFYEMDGKRQLKLRQINVDVVSDSSFVVDVMSGKGNAEVHEDMVTLFNFFEAKGYRIKWHHARRESSVLNSLMDELAANAREYMSSLVSEIPRISDEFPPVPKDDGRES